MTRGLVIGKFYPPHLGHHHLISSAARQVDRLTVLVMASSAESIGLADRVRWLSTWTSPSTSSARAATFRST
jgi:HTH-type transcriptional regulator, transcriptional repressor of NAD biosynthesis genes